MWVPAATRRPRPRATQYAYGVGYWSDRQIEEWERGWASAGDSTVCAEHLTEPALKAVVRDGACETACSYCEASARRPIAIPVDELLEHIAESLESEYTDADTLPRDEGEVLFEVPLLTAEVLENEAFEADEELLGDVLKAFGDRGWCRRNWERLPPERRLLLGWTDFCATVRQRRFLFLREETDPYDSDYVSPRQMLDELEHGLPALVVTWPPGRRLVRARVHPAAVAVGDALSLGPPPAENATANRMSADGVVMFYAADDEVTAVVETEAQANPHHDTTTAGVFVSQSLLRLVDLTRLPDVPSIFDEARRAQRPFVRFIASFAHDISRSVPARGAAGMYAPTQIVTEHIRDYVRDELGDSIDGIVYASSRVIGSRCVVLFIDSHRCGDLDVPRPADRVATLLLDRTTVWSRARRLSFEAGQAG